MKKQIVLSVVMVLFVLSVGISAFAQEDMHGIPEPRGTEPPKGGVQWAKGQAPPTGGGSTSPNLTWHGGDVMSSALVQPIYWGTSWSDGNPKIDGLKTFYQGINGSSYANTNTEYTGTNNNHVGTSIGYLDRIIDNSPAPSNGNRTSPILAEVCSHIPNPVSNGYYPVYVDTPRGHAGFCAWHSAGTCSTSTGNVNVQFAFFFNLDGDSGCDPKDTSNLHSPGLAALANVSGHEISEALTDPRLNAWYDSSGAENADKCAWTFGTNPLVTFSNGSQWKIQGNWSNKAYPNGGYKSGTGCVNGN